MQCTSRLISWGCKKFQVLNYYYFGKEKGPTYIYIYIYIYRKTGGGQLLSKEYGIKMGCYWKPLGEHIGNLMGSSYIAVL
jgi:hypothetical protein